MSRFVYLQLMSLDEARILAGSHYRITLLQVDYKLEEVMHMQLDTYEDT